MKKFFKTKKPSHRLLRCSLLFIALLLLVDGLSLLIQRNQAPLHAGAPTFTVCHAIPRKNMQPILFGKGDRYFCSNDGCYSDRYEELSVIGSYEDANICAGIAEKLQSGE